MFTKRKFSAIVAVLFTAAAFPLLMQTAAAQAVPEKKAELEQGPALEEIVVTARKREEDVMKVPIAVSVMSGTKIEDAGVKDIKELAAFTPGLFALNQDSAGVGDRRLNHLTFRGLATDSGAQFIDGSPYGGGLSVNSGGGAPPDFTDVARVEVLKGPQSVYFGRSTFAGAVNYVTKVPTNEFSGEASADIYSYDGADARVMMQGGLLSDDRLSARVSLRRYTFGGQYHNSFDQSVQMGEESTTSATLALYSKPNDHLNLSAYYSYQLDDDGPGSNGHIRAVPVGAGPTLTCNLGGTGGPYWCGALPNFSQIDVNSQLGNYGTLDPFTRQAMFGGHQLSPTPFAVDWKDGFGLKREINHVHAKGDYDFDSGWVASTLLSYSKTQLQSVIGREGLDTFGMVNTFYVNNPACVAGLPSCIVPPRPQLSLNLMNIYEDYSAELRLSSPQNNRLQGTFGASFYGTTGPPGGSFGTVNSGQLVNTGTGGIINKSSTPAIFGGLYFNVTDRFKLSGEARYQWDEIMQQQVWQVETQKLTNTFKSFSPRLTAEYTLPNNSLLYATYSRGYKPGGFNASLLSLTPYALAQLSDSITGISYDEEKLDNFEIGHKGTWFDNRLRTTLAIYQMNWKNGQVLNTQFVEQSPTGPLATVMITQNLGEVRLRGVELEAEFAATDNFTISGTMDYANNKILNYVYTPTGLRIHNSTDVTGKTLAQTPEWTASLSPTYTGQISSQWGWFSRLDAFYTSKIFVDNADLAWLSSRSIFNAHLGFKKSGGFKGEFYVNNLFQNQTMAQAGTSSSDGVFAPNTACPSCYNPDLPAKLTPAVSVLNLIGFTPPIKRTFGLRFSYSF